MIDEVARIARENGFSLRGTAKRFQIDGNGVVTINAQCVADDAYFLFIYCRTTSWDLPGERTDANDLYSLLLAAYLRSRPEPYSSALWDVLNPAVPVPDTEVYARYITFQQPDNSLVRAPGTALSEFQKVCKYVAEFQRLFPFLFTWENGTEQGIAFEGEVERWAKHVADALEEPLDQLVQFNRRIGPDWYYYRTLRRKATVLHSVRAVAALETILRGEGPGDELVGINRHLFVSHRVRSAVPRRAVTYARRVLSRLNDDQAPSVTMTPLENRVIFTGGTYALSLTRDCGLQRFREESIRVEQRHRQEARLLFRPVYYEWCDTIDDEQFELLVRELLFREAGVVRVRKVGHSRDSDRGKDLIADWLAAPPPGTRVPKGQPPAVLRKVLCQVKAVSKSVGKDAARDIRDTLDHHNATGYLLVVSSQITSDLTDHLDRIRTDGHYWVDWWTRLELEERLSTHPEISARYRHIVKSGP